MYAVPKELVVLVDYQRLIRFTLFFRVAILDTAHPP